MKVIAEVTCNAKYGERSPPILAKKAALKTATFDLNVAGSQCNVSIKLHPECESITSYKDIIILYPVTLDRYERQRADWKKFMDMLSVEWIEQYLEDRKKAA